VALDQTFGNFLIFRWLAGGDGNQVIPDTDGSRHFRAENEAIFYAKTMSDCQTVRKRWYDGFPTGDLFLVPSPYVYWEASWLVLALRNPLIL